PVLLVSEGGFRGTPRDAGRAGLRAPRAGAWRAAGEPATIPARMIESDIAANLKAVQDRIAGAARRVGRSRTGVLLVAVSKTVDVEEIRSAIAAGVPALGENRVQEAREKIAALGRPRPWHLIGHLQTNKVNYAVESFDLIHSVDRLPLAEAI